jgi:hypothetical protein
MTTPLATAPADVPTVPDYIEPYRVPVDVFETDVALAF